MAKNQALQKSKPQTLEVAFDYGDLPKSDVRSLESHARAIDAAHAKGVELILEIGRHVKAAHDVLAGSGRDGMFKPWLEQRCGFSRRSAYHYLQAFETFGNGKCATVAHFFDAKALYLLSSDNTPEEATELALERAKAGERITHKLAKEIVASLMPESDEDEGAVKRKVVDPIDLEDEALEAIRAIFNKWPMERVEQIKWLLQILINEEHDRWINREKH